MAFLLLAGCVVLVLGFALQSSKQRPLGGLLVALSLSVLLSVLIPSLVRELTPRGWRSRVANSRTFEWGWRGISVVFASTVGLSLALRAAQPHRGDREGFLIPDEASALDRQMRASLRAAGPGALTFLGMTGSGRAVRLGAKSREAHMQVVGPSGSGKSQFLMGLAGQDMSAGMPVFFMEAKGDRSDFRQFLKMAEWCGRLSQVRYFNPQDPERSMTFNPILPVPGQDATSIANQIARAIGREPTQSGEGNDYHTAVDFAKLHSMVHVFMQTGRMFTLEDCYCYFTDSRSRKKAFDLCGDRAAVSIAARELKDSKDNTALAALLRPWVTGALGRLLNTYEPQIRLEDTIEGLATYFAVPIGHLQVQANQLGRMVFAALLQIASSRQRGGGKPPLASVILDEFAEFATPVFSSFIATVRSGGFLTTLSHQDLGQLRKVQGIDAVAFARSVFNNTSGCKVCFRTPEPEDAEFWAQVLGTDRVIEDTERVQESFLAETRTGDKSRREIEAFKVHPNELKSLPPGVALVKGQGIEGCLIRTARVYPLVGDAESAPLPLVAGKKERGLSLAAEAARYSRKMSNDGESI